MAALREILIAFGVTLDASPIDKGEKKVEGFLAKVGEFGEALAGAFAVKKLWDFTEAQVALGDALGDSAVLMGLSTEELERWRYAAQFAEISGEELQAMFNKVSKAAFAAGDASSGVGKIIKNDLKVDVSKYKTSAQVFEAIGTALAGTEEGFKRTAIAQQIFGKAGGTKVLQLFKDGAAGIAAYNDEFENLGGGMLDFAEKAGAIDDAQKRLNFAWGNAKVRIAGVFLPAMDWIITKATHLSAAFGRLVEETNIVQTALVVLGAIGAAKAALIIAQWWPVIAPFIAWAAAIGLVVLALEDIYGFFTGKNSLIGKAIDAVFGDGAQEKVKAWGHGVYDVVVQLIDKVKEVFNDGSKTVVQKFEAIVGYILGDFHDKLVGSFGATGAELVSVGTAAAAGFLGTIVAACEKATQAIKGVLKFLNAPIKALIEGAPKEDDKNNADIAAGKRPADASDFDVSKKPWYARAAAAVVGFSPEQAMPVRLPGGAASHREAPIGPPVAPVINQAISVAPGTPQAQQAALARSAQAGTTAALAAPNRAAAAALERRG